MSSTIIHQPCIYGLREKCEAIELCFRLLSGDIEEALKPFIVSELQTDEDKVVSKISAAISKYISNLYLSFKRESTSAYFTEILSKLCKRGPYRLNAIRTMQPKESERVVSPVPKPSGVM
jgi:hypothetical protein